MLSKAIADALEKADPDHKDIYQENASAYSEKLRVIGQNVLIETAFSP